MSRETSAQIVGAASPVDERPCRQVFGFELYRDLRKMNPLFSWIALPGPTRTVTDASTSFGVRGGLEVALLLLRIAGIGWTQEAYRAEWLRKVEGRFPSPRGKVTTIAVPGGTAEGGFRRPDAKMLIRNTVMDLLGTERTSTHSIRPAS